MARLRTTFIPVLAVTALALTQQACAGPAPAGGATLASAASESGPLAGDRKVAISMEAGPPATLRVNERGKLVGHAEITDRSLFVLAPVSGGHRIETAWDGHGSEPACMGVRNSGVGPATVVAAACNPAARGQVFTFTATDVTDSQGRRTYRITTEAGALTFNSRDGLHVQPRQDRDVTVFALLDQGPVGC